MPKRKTKMTDEEALKHYTPGEGLPIAPSPDVDVDLPVLVKEVLDRSLASHPEFVKPELAVDRVMTNRKSALLKANKTKANKRRKK
jgi:hypothetical protein